MKKILFFILGLFIGGVSASTFFIYSENKISTLEIEKDISLYKKNIEELNKEIKKYANGLYPALLSAQKATYQNIVAALESKKISLAHRFTFSYQSNQPVFKEGTKPIEDINTEILKIKKEISAHEAESALYNPCLMKSLIETKKAQKELILSGLERILIAKKYGIPLLASEAELKKESIDIPAEPINPIKDKEAL